jgi:hypothetical protein
MRNPLAENPKHISAIGRPRMVSGRQRIPNKNGNAATVDEKLRGDAIAGFSASRFFKTDPLVVCKTFFCE